MLTKILHQNLQINKKNRPVPDCLCITELHVVLLFYMQKKNREFHCRREAHEREKLLNAENTARQMRDADNKEAALLGAEADEC